MIESLALSMAQAVLGKEGDGGTKRTADKLVDRLASISSLDKCAVIEAKLKSVKAALIKMGRKDQSSADAVADSLVWYLIKLNVSQGFKNYKHWYFVQEKIVHAIDVLRSIYGKCSQSRKSGIVSILKTIDKGVRDKGISSAYLKDADKFHAFLGARINAQALLHEFKVKGYEKEGDSEYTLGYPED